MQEIPPFSRQRLVSRILDSLPLLLFSLQPRLRNIEIHCSIGIYDFERRRNRKENVEQIENSERNENRPTRTAVRAWRRYNPRYKNEHFRGNKVAASGCPRINMAERSFSPRTVDSCFSTAQISLFPDPRKNSAAGFAYRREIFHGSMDPSRGTRR